ncbi:MAG: hypothetical protein ABSH22_03155 [Tepidisphaeraceae bacterium]
MFSSKAFIAAICVYCLAVACALWPTDSPLAPSEASAAPRLASLNGLPYCGATMQLQDAGNVAGYETACDEIAAQGGDTVMFVPSASMENASSTVIYIDTRHALPRADLVQLIAHAKADKLRVILMPIVLLDKPKSDNDWRGTIHPDDWDDWFSSYQDMMNYYAMIAEQTGVNLLVVGSELVSAEPFVDDWRATIRKIRNTFHGQLTYSSNWDHYAMVQFWDDLDIVGMNSYWKLGPDEDPKVPVAEIDKRWQDIQKDLFAWQANTKKPILLLEAGWCSLANASYEPWDYTRVDLALDLDLQKRLYQGFFESWWGKPQCAGFMLWEWTPASPGGPDDKGYTPRGKPAADVMKEWLAKPRWKVN